MVAAVNSIVEEVGDWLWIAYPDGAIPPSKAREILKLTFSPAERRRCRVLSAKAREGTLTAEEDRELAGLDRANIFLSTLHSKARLALKKAARSN